MKGREEKSGFSLIEVMIAMGVLMIGLLALVELQTFGIRYLALARQKTTASQLGANYLELLKTVPVNGPSTIMYDKYGNPFIDADGRALLDDNVVGDGIMTWHRLRPVNEEGQMVDSIENWRGEFAYLICYGVEWGGTTIPAGGGVPLSVRVVPSESDKGLALAQYPEILPSGHPDYQEIYIEVWVGWLPLGEEVQVVSGTPLRNVAEYFNRVNTTFPKYPAVFPMRKVVLSTLRKI